MRPDAELVTLTIAGDTGAFAELVARHEHSVHALAFSVLRNHHDAEDATQEAFVAAYRALPSLHKRQSFGSWVMTIVLRLARDAAQRRPVLASLASAEQAPTRDGDTAVDREGLLAAMMALPERERAVVLLRHFDGHDMRSIATITGESISTVTKRLSRAHARLRKRLEEIDRGR